MKGAILWLERFAPTAENRPSGIRGTRWYALAAITPLPSLLIKEWGEKEKNALFAENTLGSMDAVTIAGHTNNV